MKRFTKRIALFLAVILCFSVSPVIPASADDRKLIMTYDEFSVIYEITGEWGNSRNINVTIQNTGGSIIENWGLIYNPGGDIDTIWNASAAVYDDEHVLVTNAGWNSDIEIGSSVSFGYIISGYSTAPEHFSLASKRVPCMDEDFDINYQVYSDWGSGFSAMIEIKNNTSHPIMAWNLEFYGDIQDFSTSAFRILKQSGNQFTVKGTYNNNIPANSSVYMSFNGKGNAGTISDFSLSKVVNELDNDDTDYSISGSYIYAIGEYNEENSQLGMYWYTDALSGTFDILSSDDKITFEAEATVKDEYTYLYTIPNDTKTKYFKIKAAEVPESNIIELRLNGDSYEVILEDSDGDGLADIYEEMFGTDPSRPDTDNDGLTDYEELFLAGTDPLQYNSVHEHLSDSDADCDKDGLSNKEEILLGTDIQDADSDADGLLDGDEVLIYSTNPLSADTDSDTLSDWEELQLGLDPTKEMSDRITHDSLRLFQQTLPDDAISETLLSDSQWLIPSVSGEVSGLIEHNMRIIPSSLDSFDDNRALVSSVIKVETAYEVPMTLTFDYSKASDAYSGDINNLAVFKYDEDITILDTIVDTTSSEISAEINGEGTYFILDIDEFLKSVGIDVFKNISDGISPVSLFISSFSAEEQEYSEYIDILDNDGNIIDRIQNSQVSTVSGSSLQIQPYGLGTSSRRSLTKQASGKADIVFVIDTTGSMGGVISNVKNNVNRLADALVNEYNIDANFALVEYRDITCDGVNSTKLHRSGTSNWFTDINKFKAEINSLAVTGGGDTPETPIDGLEMARRLDFRGNANRFVVLITDAGYKTNNNYGISSLSRMTDLFIQDKVVVSVISTSSSTYSDINTRTDGMYGYIYGNFGDILTKLADKVGEVTNDGDWIILDDYQSAKITGDDTDEDGIKDYDELIEKYTKDLSLFVGALLAANSVPRDLYTDNTKIDVWSYKSNPALPDTDFDGIPDNADINPRNNTFTADMRYERYGKEKVSEVEFNVDYRNYFSSSAVYNENIAVLTSLFASDIYDNIYIELTEGAKGGSEDPTSFKKIFQIQDVENIHIKSADYSVDKDDVTQIVIGHKLIEYKGVKKELIFLTVRGTNGTNEEWSSNFDVGANTEAYYNAAGSSHPHWLNREYHHKGFDVAANRVIDKVNDYIHRHNLSGSYDNAIIVTGHSRGAAISNLVGKYFEDKPGFDSFTYTFAAPNVTKNPNASAYKTIFNVLNEDDIFPKLPLEDWGFTKYGKIKSLSVEKKYENKFGSAEKGTWEWLVGNDYNNDGGTNRTLSSFAKIANSREELYILDSSGDGKVWENNTGHTTRQGAEKELAELTATLESEKLLRFCKLDIVGGGFLTPYHVEVNYCPAYLMQVLSNVTTGVGPMLGRDVKGKYASAKASFVASSGEIPGHLIGGMTDPHLQITYYLLAKNNFKDL